MTMAKLRFFFNVALSYLLVNSNAQTIRGFSKTTSELSCTDLYIRATWSIRVLSECESVKSCAQVVHVRGGIVLALFL